MNLKFMNRFILFNIFINIITYNTLIYNTEAYNINPVRSDISKITFTNPEHVIGYLSSLSEYTIISIGEKQLEFNETLYNCNMDSTYFANLECIADDICKKTTCNYIRLKYRNVESGEDLWFFHRGFHIGGRNEIYKFIEKRSHIAN